MGKRSFLKSGSKEIVLHGDLLRYRNEDEIKDIVVEKIDSISIENTKGIQSNLAWAFLGFIVSLISWYFLDESVLSTSIAIISMIAGLILFGSYFLLSTYSTLVIKTSRLDISFEFSSINRRKVNEFRKIVLERLK
ncbi:MAG: hypothetical protein FI730_05915 [SAR202 cluster bacterium]|nr:hypothetical protein [SAR202 cluster bacterium]MQF93978.1 hypothetical protein [SAR202 cluster bacterium]|tara:strand:+ start:2209 stop:2616 length:408 start_codon:yes stop_codon:yes gene_type:complete